MRDESDIQPREHREPAAADHDVVQPRARSFPGTVSISAKTLYALIGYIRAPLARFDIYKLVIVTGHGANYVLSNVAQGANVDGPAVSPFPPRSRLGPGPRPRWPRLRPSRRHARWRNRDKPDGWTPSRHGA
ncbi:creatininase family protein [Streptomyces sp. NPDC093224]|uniref:creatininase family protein n=1 Tax=Streptomyces sp. NPDC093224 TaxID=3155198 RepID=UPI00343CCF45